MNTPDPTDPLEIPAFLQRTPPAEPLSAWIDRTNRELGIGKYFGQARRRAAPQPPTAQPGQHEEATMNTSLVEMSKKLTGKTATVAFTGSKGTKMTAKAKTAAPNKAAAPMKPMAQKAKAPKTAAPAKAKAIKTPAADDSRAAQAEALMRRPGTGAAGTGGVSLPELMKLWGWQEHSVRGFVANTMRGKLKLPVVRTNTEKRGRVYELPTK